MQTFRLSRAAALAVLAIVIGGARGALGAVSLGFTDGDPSPTAGAVAPGGTLNLTLNLTSTAEQTTGLDYYLRAPAAVSGRFRIADRNLAGSPYADPLNDDAAVEAPPAAVLAPTNELDLGATLESPDAPLGAGTHRVAAYAIAIDAATPLGAYTVETFSNPGTGYVTGGPVFNDVPFNQHASYQLVVSRYPGDANLNGMVDVNDLGILATNYSTASGATWQTGDFNFDGAVDVSDLGILSTNYGAGTVAGVTGLSAALPEPGSALLLLAAPVLVRRRR